MISKMNKENLLKTYQSRMVEWKGGLSGEVELDAITVSFCIYLIR